MQAHIEHKRFMPVIAVFDFTSPKDRIAHLKKEILSLEIKSAEYYTAGDYRHSDALLDIVADMQDERDFLQNLPMIFSGANRG